MKYSSYIRDMREYRWFGKKVKKDFKKKDHLLNLLFFKMAFIVACGLYRIRLFSRFHRRLLAFLWMLLLFVDLSPIQNWN